MLRKGVVIMAMLGMIVTGFYQWFFAMTRSPIGAEPKEAVVSIAPGTTLSRLSDQLVAQELVEYGLVFNLLGRLTGLGSKLRAGDYRVDTRWSYQELLEHLVKDPEVQYPLTLVEGLTLAEVMRVVQAHGKIARSLPDADTAALAQALGVSGHPEGLLLPDTYFVRAHEPEVSVYRRAHAALNELLAREWPKRDAGLPFNTPQEALVAASIVEKETGIAAERPQIAGVLVRRLQRGMPLQMDPTVIYGLGERFDGNLRKKDLTEPTPYNTYVNKGLPPTPIALASAESIYAVLHPAPGNALYFVARGDGGHVFSDTLEAHNAAVKRYVELLRGGRP